MPFVERRGASRWLQRIAVAFTSVVSLSLVACAEGAGETTRAERMATMASGEETMPEFSGPWAASFASWYETTESDTVRDVIGDEVVTDEELAETVAAFRQCLEAKGVRLTYHGFGGYGTNFDPELGAERAHEVDAACSLATGHDIISSLYVDTHRNPENLDESQIVTDCLVDRKVVSAAFTKEDLVSLGADDAPLLDAANGIAEFEQCLADPLGLEPRE